MQLPANTAYIDKNKIIYVGMKVFLCKISSKNVTSYSSGNKMFRSFQFSRLQTLFAEQTPVRSVFGMLLK